MRYRHRPKSMAIGLSDNTEIDERQALDELRLDKITG